MRRSSRIVLTDKKIFNYTAPVLKNPHQEPESKEEMMFKHIDHLALHVTDVAAATTFYAETFGFTTAFEASVGGGRRIAFIQLGGTLIELTQRDQAEPMSGFHLCLQATDFDADLAGLRARGLPVVTEATPSSPRGPLDAGSKRAVFRGPHGELIEIRG